MSSQGLVQPVGQSKPTKPDQFEILPIGGPEDIIIIPIDECPPGVACSPPFNDGIGVGIPVGQPMYGQVYGQVINKLSTTRPFCQWGALQADGSYQINLGDIVTATNVQAGNQVQINGLINGIPSQIIGTTTSTPGLFTISPTVNQGLITASRFSTDSFPALRFCIQNGPITYI